MSPSSPVQEPTPSPPPATAGAPAPQLDVRKHVGFRLIITYKFVKAALMLGVALWLTISPGAALRSLESLTRDLIEGGLVFGRLGRWIHDHLSSGLMLRGAILAWLDSLSSALEAVLLLTGKPWAQWVVILGLAALLPFEIHSIWHRPGLLKVLVLLANALIVAYLAREQIVRARVLHQQTP